MLKNRLLIYIMMLATALCGTNDISAKKKGKNDTTDNSRIVVYMTDGNVEKG